MMTLRMASALAAVAMAAACAQAAPAPDQTLVERGRYIVTSVGGCNDCHTPMTPTGPDMAQSLQGADIVFAPKVDMPWASHAPRLSGGPENFSHEEFVAFLQTGVRPDGTHATPPMPPFRLNEADARAVAAYIESMDAAG